MKTKLNYTVRTTRAPGETRDSIVPVIVERLSPVELATVVENCIDRGLIAGLKPTAARGIAEGVASQIAREFSLGRGVQFGRYFYGRPYLSGTVDANGRLTSDNRVNVRLYKGAEFKLGLDDFSFTFDGAGDSVKLDNVYGDTPGAGGNTYGQVVEGSPVKVNGRNLYAAGDTDKVIFSEAGGTGSVEVADFAYQGADLLSFAWPEGLVAGKKYLVRVERTDPNGVVRASASKSVTVVAGATPPAPEPIGQSEDGTVQVFSMTDQTGAEILTAGNNWRIDGLGLAPEGFTTEGWVLNNVRLEANGIDAEAVIVEGDSDKKHIVVRTDSEIANPGDYEVTFHFDLQEYGSIESESFTVTQMIRVPQSA